IENSVLIDKVPLCRHCFSSHLVFTETCPYCQDSDIYLEESIHHFQCANISPESSYVKGDDLVCPKCRKKLRHIGVDYDRPSALYHCRICSHSFSKPKMRVTCTSCTSVSTPDSLLFFPVHERVYFTLEGVEAFTKNDSISDDTTAYPLLVDLHVYQSYVRNRVAIYGMLENEANTVTVTEVRDSLDKEYVHELCQVINELDPNAVLTYRRGTLYAVQLGGHAKEVFEENFDKLKGVSQRRLGIDSFQYESTIISSSLQGAEYINTLL
ncbi:hypothetical protein LJC12_05410, partial [Odoribacter sp. OttesenSCG-928-J03]|nr:hypothetical protein [Odoribacter sp. OttesenSCG-928-J03]